MSLTMSVLVPDTSHPPSVVQILILSLCFSHQHLTLMPTQMSLIVWEPLWKWLTLRHLESLTLSLVLRRQICRRYQWFCSSFPTREG